MKPHISPHSSAQFNKPARHTPANPLPLISAIALVVFAFLMGMILG